MLDRAHVDHVNEWKRGEWSTQKPFADYVCAWTDAHAPKRILVKSRSAFLYALLRYPVEVVWPVRDQEEIAALEARLPFDFVVVHESQPLRDVFKGNPRYRRVDQFAGRSKYRIWQRLY